MWNSKYSNLDSYVLVSLSCRFHKISSFETCFINFRTDKTIIAVTVDVVGQEEGTLEAEEVAEVAQENPAEASVEGSVDLSNNNRKRSKVE